MDDGMWLESSYATAAECGPRIARVPLPPHRCTIARSATCSPQRPSAVLRGECPFRRCRNSFALRFVRCIRIATRNLNWNRSVSGHARTSLSQGSKVLFSTSKHRPRVPLLSRARPTSRICERTAPPFRPLAPLNSCPAKARSQTSCMTSAALRISPSQVPTRSSLQISRSQTGTLRNGRSCLSSPALACRYLRLLLKRPVRAF